MKIICVGRNYSDHIKELDNKTPEEPILFLKPDSAILLKKQAFYIPEFSKDVHHEVELLVRINRLGKHIDRKFAHKYYDEIGLGIDFTARDLQTKLKKEGLPWEKAKAFDGSAVVGEFINKNQIDDIDNLSFSLRRNEEIVQEGNSMQMIWKIDALIENISKYFTLKIGDIIFTGTPAGVGPVASGDTLEGYLTTTKMFSINIK